MWHRSRGRTLRSLGVGAVLILLAGTAAACGSDPEPTTTTTSSSAAAASPSAITAESTAASTADPANKDQICQARDQLKTSITALTDMKLLASGTTAIRAAIDQVQTDLDALKEAAKDDYQPQVTALQTAIEQLKTAAGNLDSGNASDSLLAVGTAVVATGTAAQELFSQLTTACGS